MLEQKNLPAGRFSCTDQGEDQSVECDHHLMTNSL